MIILDDLDFEWKEEKVDRVIAMWKEGLNVINIAAEINRSTDEVFLLLMHLSRKGKIKKRKGYFWGRKDKK